MTSVFFLLLSTFSFPNEREYGKRIRAKFPHQNETEGDRGLWMHLGKANLRFGRLRS